MQEGLITYKYQLAVNNLLWCFCVFVLEASDVGLYSMLLTLREFVLRKAKKKKQNKTGSCCQRFTENHFELCWEFLCHYFMLLPAAADEDYRWMSILKQVVWYFIPLPSGRTYQTLSFRRARLGRSLTPAAIAILNSRPCWRSPHPQNCRHARHN